MSKTLFLFIPGILFLFFSSCSVDKMKKGQVNQANNIHSYLIREAKKITDNSLNDMRSLNDWNKIRSQRYNEYIEMLGLKDLSMNGKRSDLNVKITGTIQKDGYRIEKLYYESLPGLYVPANLYIPDHINGKAPAILYVCGHAETQKVYYQAYPRKYAQLGFVCLIVETIQLGEVRGEHHGCYSRGWFNWYSRGYTPAGVEVWNGIRGIDLLCARPEVDPEKIGVTGISGGGAQSWFIAAADPRIKAVSPVCGASTLEAQITSRTIDDHCDCMMPINTYRIDIQNIGALIAPRPLLIGQANRDGWFTIESVRRLYRDIKKVYDLYGAAGNIGLVETPGGHSYHRISRERINSFFMEHLMGKKVTPEETGDIDESPGTQLSSEELKVYVDGPPADDRTTTIQDSFIPLTPAPEISNEKELVAFRDSVRKFLLRETFGAFPEKPVPLHPILLHRTDDYAKFGKDYYSIATEEGWRLKIDIRWNYDPSTQKPLMIVLRNAGVFWRNPSDEQSGADSLIGKLKDNYNVACFDVRGVGESGWDQNQQWDIRRSSAWIGRTIASMQVYDVLRAIEFCRSLKGVEPLKIGIAAEGPMTVVALYAALLDGNCETLVLEDLPESQDRPSRSDGTGDAIEMLNCLQVTDVYQLPALLSPARIVVSGNVPNTYQWSEEVLKKLGKGSFNIIKN